jgi:hypothetical protein
MHINTAGAAMPSATHSAATSPTATTGTTATVNSTSNSNSPADVPMGGCSLTEDPYLQWKPRGKMIKEEGGVRLMDSYLWASVYDEVSSLPSTP